MLLIFGLGIAITTVILIESYWLITAKYDRAEREVRELDILKSKSLHNFHRFVEEDVISEAYFKSKKSANLVSLKHNSLDFLRLIYFMRTSTGYNAGTFYDSIIYYELDQLRSIELFNKILLQRGYLLTGYEGAMRKHAHDLENYSAQIGLVNLLQLRRHEKDFIIRQEMRYVNKFNSLCDLVQSRLNSGAKELLAREHLKLYKTNFNSLVACDRLLGLKSDAGLKMQFETSAEKQMTLLRDFESYLFQQKIETLTTMRFAYVLLFGILLLGCVIAAKKLSSNISAPILDLDKEISKLIAGRFSKKFRLNKVSKDKEIVSLSENIIIMETLLIDQLNLLKQNKKDMDLLFSISSNDISVSLRKIDYLLSELKLSSRDPHVLANLMTASTEISSVIGMTGDLQALIGLKSQDLEVAEIKFEDLFKSIRENLINYPWFDNIVFSVYINSHQSLYASEYHLRTVFQNLIEFSVLNANSSKKTSFIRISIEDENSETVVVKIEDNGIGISEHEAKHLFDYPTTRPDNNTSFSLYLVKTSLARIGSKIEFESSLNKGTLFTVRIPISQIKLSATNLVA